MKKARLPIIAPVSSLLVFVFLLVSFLAAPLASAEDWIYTVKPGDDLWTLSKRYLVSMRYWQDLVALNKVDDPYHLQPGSSLRFPETWLKKGASVATIGALIGKATISEQRSGRMLEARPGSLLWDGDIIRTDANSNATLHFADGSSVLLQAGSELKIERLMSYGDTGMADTELQLESGRTHNTVRPKQGRGSRFEISTPSAIAAVRGTEYRISADADGSSRTEVLTGTVGVDSGGAARTVPGGFGTVSYSDREPLEPVRLLPAPDLSRLPHTVTRIPFLLRPEPVPGARQYRLQIAADKLFSTLLVDALFPSADTWGPDLPDGSYFIRLQGIDEHGLEGLYSSRPLEIQAHPFPPMQIKPAEQAAIEEPAPTFQWTEPQDAAGYRFQLAKDESFVRLLLDAPEVAASTFSPSLALKSGSYFWRVATTDRSGKTGPFSDSQQFRKLPPAPDMSDATMDAEALVFHWRRAEEGRSFHCQIAASADFADPIADETVAEPRFSLQRFEPADYFIRVAIVDGEGYAGPFSPFQKVTVPSPPPSPSLLVTAGIFLLLIVL